MPWDYPAIPTPAGGPIRGAGTDGPLVQGSGTAAGGTVLLEGSGPGRADAQAGLVAGTRGGCRAALEDVWLMCVGLLGVLRQAIRTPT